jgi:hypothetical protein
MIQPSLFTKEIPGFPGYKADYLGNIYGKTGAILTPVVTRDGYLKVNLVDTTNKLKTVQIHRLILTTFAGSPPPEKPQAMHRDGNKKNNYLGNLSWGSAKENAADKIRHGTAKRNISQSKFTIEQIVEIRSLSQQGNSYKAIAAQFNTCISQIHYIVKGTYWGDVKSLEPKPKKTRKPRQYTQLEIPYAS